MIKFADLTVNATLLRSGAVGSLFSSEFIEDTDLQQLQRENSILELIDDVILETGCPLELIDDVAELNSVFLLTALKYLQRYNIILEKSVFAGAGAEFGKAEYSEYQKLKKRFKSLLMPENSKKSSNIKIKIVSNRL